MERHFTPTGSSWINQVERWFGYLAHQMIRRGAHKTIHALEADVRAWVKDWNQDPRPFIWTKTAEEIPDSLARFCRRISGAGHQNPTPTSGVSRTWNRLRWPGADRRGRREGRHQRQGVALLRAAGLAALHPESGWPAPVSGRCRRRVGLIQQLHAAGPPSRIVREVLPFADSGEVSPRLLELLEAERDRLDRQMADLRTVRDRMDDCITEAHQQGPHRLDPAAGFRNGTGSATGAARTGPAL
ncbi:hypothetical protein GCM10010145_61110 [Streptomyces ruber]|uniref:Transposase n=2 Tax=Streptomyces TaxID=1883 RepID=A0A918EYP9_9ACTN|nr:hypothetical protein GCM10010145_61110 [Streptomyces ruber]